MHSKSTQNELKSSPEALLGPKRPPRDFQETSKSLQELPRALQARKPAVGYPPQGSSLKPQCVAAHRGHIVLSSVCRQAA
eukprot:9905982-Karenia_brevis.AAC.1